MKRTVFILCVVMASVLPMAGAGVADSTVRPTQCTGTSTWPCP